jgi:hypothetical protein
MLEQHEQKAKVGDRIVKVDGRSGSVGEM